ncbi:MAG: SDR family NAD(P)-dependent oxidoreductase, partial [Novosphingobium sp.]|nr:SDR family NAD(P)-dependent oxidoreductase [Novosphingobium sp.]
MLFENRFSGRTAVITGGAAGIGLTIASRIEAEGGKVAIWDRDAAAIDAAIGDGRAHKGCVVDVSDYDSVEAAARETVESLGKIDILVCSAGITGPNTTTWEYPIEEWRKVYDINLHGVFHCNRAVVPGMIENGYGRIVNIASVAGKEGNPNAPAYSSSKAAVIGLTKS